MKSKIFIIFMTLIFLVINLYTAFLTLIDYLAEYKTIIINSQNDFIVQEIKEHFNIGYNIRKVTFWTGIPDGYYLNIYNDMYQVERVFEDNHEDSEICDYFRNERADIPKHLYYLIIEIFVEIIIINKIRKKNNVKN